MSRLSEKLKSVASGRVQPLGFGAAAKKEKGPQMLLIAGLSDSGADIEAIAAGGAADALLVSIADPEREKEALARIGRGAGDIPWGICIEAATPETAQRLADAGCDFLAFDATRTAAEVLELEDLGMVLRATPPLAEGLIAKMDVVDIRSAEAIPVDYKRGKVPKADGNAWEPECVQLCAQGLILRDNGYHCEGGILYFIESRRRVSIPFDEPLVERTQELIRQMREMAAGRTMPPPLADSPKCPRCSLVGICLPDETCLLTGREAPDRTFSATLP